MKKRIAKILALMLSFILLATTVLPLMGGNFVSGDAYAASKPTYTISTKSKPYDKKIAKYSTYNKYSKHWYLFSSYLQRLEKTGGGTLIVKKGNYNIPKTLFVPSNVTIKFKNGVVLNKTTKTGTKKLTSTGQLFHLVAPSKSSKKNAVSNYKGTKNVKFIGEGTVTFKMNNPKTKGASCIVMAQNQNILFKNITFKDVKAHFIELDASKNVTIDSCKFLNVNLDHKKSKTCEAINLDTPDTKTGGFSFKWSKKDKKPNVGVTIKNCVFQNMNRAIGTHKYSQNGSTNVMHKNIKIIGNTFKKVTGYEGVVVPYNWQNVEIKDNKFVGNGKDAKTYGIAAHSVVSADITGNTFSNFYGSIIIRRGFSSSGYSAPAAVSVSGEQLKNLCFNYVERGTVKEPRAQYTTGTYWSTISMKYYDLRFTDEETGNDETNDSGDNNGTDPGPGTGDNTGTDPGTGDNTGNNTGTDPDPGTVNGDNTGNEPDPAAGDGTGTGGDTGTDPDPGTGSDSGNE